MSNKKSAKLDYKIVYDADKKIVSIVLSDGSSFSEHSGLDIYSLTNISKKYGVPFEVKGKKNMRNRNLDFEAFLAAKGI